MCWASTPPFCPYTCSQRLASVIVPGGLAFLLK